jgi:hypothetical protein
MAIDLAALKAKLAAQKAATTTGESNAITASIQDSNVGNTVAAIVTAISDGSSNNSTDVSPPVPSVSAPAVLGTAKTTEIDHIDFLSKMNRLAEAIHTQHPTMPVLLMQIHKQLRADPELVTTLDEDGIGIIVKGLQIQTKTELVSVVVKESKSKKNKTPISVDMF